MHTEFSRDEKLIQIIADGKRKASEEAEAQTSSKRAKVEDTETDNKPAMKPIPFPEKVNTNYQLPRMSYTTLNPFIAAVQVPAPPQPYLQVAARVLNTEAPVVPTAYPTTNICSNLETFRDFDTGIKSSSLQRCKTAADHHNSFYPYFKENMCFANNKPT